MYCTSKYTKKGGKIRRVEIDVRGVFDSFYRIVDNTNDQERIIKASDWPKYKAQYSIVEEILHHRVIKTPVVRTFDLAEVLRDPSDD